MSRVIWPGSAGAVLIESNANGFSGTAPRLSNPGRDRQVSFSACTHAEGALGLAERPRTGSRNRGRASAESFHAYRGPDHAPWAQRRGFPTPRHRKRLNSSTPRWARGGGTGHVLARDMANPTVRKLPRNAGGRRLMLWVAKRSQPATQQVITNRFQEHAALPPGGAVDVPRSEPCHHPVQNSQPEARNDRRTPQRPTSETA